MFSAAVLHSSMMLRFVHVQEVTKLVYEVTEDDVTRAKNQLKAMQLFGIGNTGGELCSP